MLLIFVSIQIATFMLKHFKESDIIMKELTPRQIVKELDKYIIGQDKAKKSVAIALRNRWRRQKVTGDLKKK